MFSEQCLGIRTSSRVRRKRWRFRTCLWRSWTSSLRSCTLDDSRTRDGKGATSPFGSRYFPSSSTFRKRSDQWPYMWSMFSWLIACLFLGTVWDKGAGGILRWKPLPSSDQDEHCGDRSSREASQTWESACETSRAKVSGENSTGINMYWKGNFWLICSIGTMPCCSSLCPSKPAPTLSIFDM